MRDWLEAAPVYDVRTSGGNVDPEDPAYSTLIMNCLTIDGAVDEIGRAVNESLGQHPCPDSLSFSPRTHRSQSEFEYLSFATVSPTLPDRYSDVLVRQRVFDHAPRSRIGDSEDTRPEVQHDVGSIYRSPSGDVVVLWRRSS